MTRLTLEKEFEKVALNRSSCMQGPSSSNTALLANDVENKQSPRVQEHKCTSGAKAFLIPFAAVAAIYASGQELSTFGVLITATSATLAGLTGLALHRTIKTLRHRKQANG